MMIKSGIIADASNRGGDKLLPEIARPIPVADLDWSLYHVDFHLLLFAGFYRRFHSVSFLPFTIRGLRLMLFPALDEQPTRDQWLDTYP
jgi:hypothetical protein